LLFELGDAVGQLLAVGRELLSLLPKALFALLGVALGGAALLKNAAELVGLLLLLLGELIGLAGHLANAPGILLALQRAESLGGFAEAIGSAAGIRGALLLGGGAVEGVGGFAQGVDSALDARIAGGLRLTLRSALRLAARLTLRIGL